MPSLHFMPISQQEITWGDFIDTTQDTINEVTNLKDQVYSTNWEINKKIAKLKRQVCFLNKRSWIRSNKRRKK